MGIVLGRFSKDGKGEYEVFLKGYSGSRHDSARGGKDSQRTALECPRLAVCWWAQPTVLRDVLANPLAMERGVTCRPLIFDSEARMERDEGDAPRFTLAHRWSDLVEEILNVRFSTEVSGPQVISCTAEAKEVFRDFHNEAQVLQSGRFRDIGGEFTRWRENAIKVAALFALALRQNSIDPKLAKNAVSVVRWCAWNYLEMLRAGRDRKITESLARVEKVIAEAGGQIHASELQRSHGIHRDDIEPLIARFPSRVTVEHIPQRAGRPGRPAIVYRLSEGIPGASHTLGG